MQNNKPQIIVIFGAKGDLTKRKLLPAFYNLFLSNYLNPQFKILCIDYISQENVAYITEIKLLIDEFSRTGKTEEKKFEAFSKNIEYLQGDFTKTDIFSLLQKNIEKQEAIFGKKTVRLFFYSVAPRFIQTISNALFTNKIVTDKNLHRIVIEKPFGVDLISAKKLNKFLLLRFDEKQIYRIDHYLGKETVQNILATRFANNVFEPLWNNRHIEQVQITVAETVGVGTRANYYDNSGAIKDMIQNHLLQMLCLVAMDAPKAYNATEVRNKKLAVLKKIKPFTTTNIAKQIILGQYSKGIINKVQQVGYHNELNIPKQSKTETYFAAKFLIDNERWKNVPFYLRTGKCLAKKTSKIVIFFKPTKNKIFKGDINANKLVIAIQPDDEISLWFESKVPGMGLQLKNVEMDFTYKESYTETIPEAYETLLLDALMGDATLFMRADQVEAAWKVVMPILENIKNTKSNKLHLYKAGAEGPNAAFDLLKKDKRKWESL